jgi:endogenous inhibitor of DNA gyrase (YacG/DUF329 family)
MKINCPVCHTVTSWEENPRRPFCSERCRMIDLGRWVSGEYRIEGESVSESDVSPEKENNNV